ncbi:MAG: carboxypeptidase regulatory-like domain-containing protein, partial [Bacteroidota bacterium]
MKRSLFALLAFVVVYLLQLTTLQHCATPTAPSGGARDTIGPVLVVEETTPNFQTNFKPEEIVLTFDEWVELDPQQQILISPPLELGEDNRPQLRKRSLVISFEGLELRDSVTYVVNVGAAIKDLNEGNPTENLRFVFATGPVLDSATVSGTLVEDFSGEPIEDATFTLYGNLADTAATTENPTYFAQTDEEGDFTIYNIRPGRYRAVALLRNPSATNYFADFSGYAQPQSVGFIDTIITVADGSNSVGAVRLSPVPKPIRINAADTAAYGLLTLTLNQTASEVDLLTATSFLRRNDKDSLKLYYRDSLPPLTLVVGLDTLPADTFT